MTKAEERAYYERGKENNLRYIRTKIPHATPRELALIAAFIRGLGIAGWSESEPFRGMESKPPCAVE